MKSGTLLALMRRALIVAGGIPVAACGGAADTLDAGACYVEPDAALTVRNTCGVTNGDCVLADDTCARLCGRPTYCAQEKADPATIDCSVCGGRATEGIAAPEGSVARSRVAEHLARSAHLERASVVAFQVLHDELAAHRAPRRLLRAALRARADEERHGRLVGGLARRFGAAVDDVRFARRPVRDLRTVAVENAIEGCVRETYGAVVAAWQGERAEDRRVRAVMKLIARDEARHAALAWRIASWVSSRLDATAREEVRAARRRALAELRLAIRDGAADEETARTCGLPRPDEAGRIVDALRSEVWAS